MYKYPNNLKVLKQYSKAIIFCIKNSGSTITIKKDIDEYVDILLMYEESSIILHHLLTLLSTLKGKCDIINKLDELYRKTKRLFVGEISQDKIDCNLIFQFVQSIPDYRSVPEKTLILPISQIIIPKCFSTPSATILDKIAYYYEITGSIDKAIEVIQYNGDYILTDGYARLIFARRKEIEELTAKVLDFSKLLNE